MMPNLDIVYRGLDQSPELTAVIESKIIKLKRFQEFIPKSHITIDVPHGRQRKCRTYRISVELNYNGKLVSVSNQSTNPYSAVANVFDTLTRQVKRSKRKIRSRRYHSKYPTGLSSD